MRQKTEGDEVIYLVIPPFLQQRVLKQCVIAMHLHLCPIIIGLQATVTGSQMKGVQVCVILSIFISTTYLFVSCLNRVCLELCLDWQLVITVVVSDRQRIFSLTNTFRESGSRISFWWMLKRKYRLVNLNKWAEYQMMLSYRGTLSMTRWWWNVFRQDLCPNSILHTTCI